MRTKITIKFIENYPPYQKGETATFFDRQSNRLIDMGFAEYVAGDMKKESTASKLMALRGATKAKSISGPTETRHIPGPVPAKTSQDDESGDFNPNMQIDTKTGQNSRKCGECGQPGHTKNHCPLKK